MSSTVSVSTGGYAFVRADLTLQIGTPYSRQLNLTQSSYAEPRFTTRGGSTTTTNTVETNVDGAIALAVGVVLICLLFLLLFIAYVIRVRGIGKSVYGNDQQTLLVDRHYTVLSGDDSEGVKEAAACRGDRFDDCPTDSLLDAENDEEDDDLADGRSNGARTRNVAKSSYQSVDTSRYVKDEVVLKEEGDDAVRPTTTSGHRTASAATAVAGSEAHSLPRAADANRTTEGKETGLNHHPRRPPSSSSSPQQPAAASSSRVQSGSHRGMNTAASAGDTTATYAHPPKEGGGGQAQPYATSAALTTEVQPMAALQERYPGYQVRPPQNASAPSRGGPGIGGRPGMSVGTAAGRNAPPAQPTTTATDVGHATMTTNDDDRVMSF